MNRFNIKFLLIFIIIFQLINSCKNITAPIYEKKNAYLFYNNDYYNIYENENKIFSLIKKNLLRNFFNVKIIKVKTFADYEPEIKQLLKQKKEGLLFINNYFIPFLFNSEINLKKQHLKILTCDADFEKFNNEINYSIFNILIDIELIYNEILIYFNEYSETNDLSDCSIILNTDYSICQKIYEKLDKLENSPEILIVNDNRYKLKEINELIDKKKVIVFMGFSSNKYLMDLNYNKKQTVDKNQEKQDTTTDTNEDIIEEDNKTIIEIFTNFGEINSNVDYKIDYNWEYAVNIAMHSYDFKKFISYKEKTPGSNNYIIKNKAVIYSKEYNHDKRIDSIIEEFE